MLQELRHLAEERTTALFPPHVSGRGKSLLKTNGRADQKCLIESVERIGVKRRLSRRHHEITLVGDGTLRFLGLRSLAPTAVSAASMTLFGPSGGGGRAGPQSLKPKNPPTGGATYRFGGETK